MATRATRGALALFASSIKCPIGFNTITGIKVAVVNSWSCSFVRTKTSRSDESNNKTAGAQQHSFHRRKFSPRVLNERNSALPLVSLTHDDGLNYCAVTNRAIVRARTTRHQLVKCTIVAAN